MRQAALALLLSCPLLAVACSSNSPAGNNTGEMASANLAAVPLPHYTVAAGAVTGNRSSGINATFRIVQATAPNGSPDSGIPSDLLGGACIVFRASDLGYSQMAGKTCHTQEDCDTGEGQGYCEMSTGQCWARPNVPDGQRDPLCNRSVDYNPQKPWPANTDVSISAGSIPVSAYNLHPNAKALVIACVRGKGAKNGCGDLNSIVKWGQPTAIP